MKKFLLVFLIFVNIVFARPDKTIINEGLTESQVYNIKLYTIRALNLSLDAYTALSQRVVNHSKVKDYLNGALFFLNEASQYSPGYFIRRQIESLIKRIKLYPNENYTTDIRVLMVNIEEISGDLDNYQLINEKLQEIYENVKKGKNKDAKDLLQEVQNMISVANIDEPLDEAKNLIVTAEEHLRAGKYHKSKQAIELALTPLIAISTRENLYIALTREYLVKAKYSYEVDYSLSKSYIQSAVYSINKAYWVSSEESREQINQIRKKINELYKKYDNYSVTEKDFEDIINLIKSL
ncbi:YfdX family protein [Persephonella sp.]|uniref:YfdX family protein n=1 Tax=Persephonella sp. TaxID=2060922 RepID=UPI002607BF22|nr:YfdX family protein [Persephonella sp.]